MRQSPRVRSAEALERIAEQSEARDSTADLYSVLKDIAEALERIADALEDVPDFDTVEAAGLDGTMRATGKPVTWRAVAEATRPPF